MDRIVGASFASLFGLLICAVPALVGAWFLLRPSERLLELMRPLSLAAIFAALCGVVLSMTSTLSFVGRMDTLDALTIRRTAAGAAEGLAPVVVCFALLTVAWVCVALGMRRGWRDSIRG